jgi:tetratricopeptide (TPR) repeat protein
VSKEKETVSTEKNEKDTREQELWDRISTTEGAERAEVLDELSHIAYNRSSYTECLNLIESSLEIYYKLGGAQNYLKEMTHLYEGKVHCLENLKEMREVAETFEIIVILKALDQDDEGHLEATRSAARAWYDVKEWQKSLDGHTAAIAMIDPDATPFSRGIDLINVGMAYAKLELFDEAITYYLSARSLFKEAKSPEYVKWCDNYLALAYIEVKNGTEAKFHALHYLNYSKVAMEPIMEGYARFRLGLSHLLCEEYVEAEEHLTRSLELLILESDKDWEDIVAINKGLAQVLTALGREKEANERLDRIKTIEETIAA